MKKIFQITVQVTDKCNLRCKHCGIWKANKKKDFTLKKYDDFCNRLSKKYNPKVFCLCGGEPFLRKDLKEVADITRRYFPNIKLNTSTNASMPIKINKISKEIRFDNITVSLDGLKTNKQIRGVNSKIVLKTANLLKEHTNVFIQPTLMKMNVEEIPDLMNICLKYDCFFFTVYRKDEFFRNEYDDEIALSEEDEKRAVELLSDYKKYLSVWCLIRYLSGKSYPFDSSKVKNFDNHLNGIPILKSFDPVSVVAGYNLYWKILWKKDVWFG